MLQQEYVSREARLFKLTPSMLSFLPDDCLRCFWLRARNGLYGPSMPFPTVFERYHALLQHYFVGRCPSTLSPDLPPGRCLGYETWVKSRPLDLPGINNSCYLHGRLDHLVRFDDDTWGVIDYKTTSITDDHVKKYARQLHAYAWALEQAAPGELCRTPVSRLGILCIDPVDLEHYVPGEDARFRLRTRWVPVERRDEAFAHFLSRIVSFLSRPDPPDPSPGCSCCKYFHRRTLIEKSLENRSTGD